MLTRRAWLSGQLTLDYGAEGRRFELLLSQPVTGTLSVKSAVNGYPNEHGKNKAI